MRVEPDELFDVFCQKQYSLPRAFVRHVTEEHPGVALNLRDAHPWFEEIAQELECENPF